jgi:hypothetical protein
VALVRTDVLEDLSASIIRVTRIGELGTMLTVTRYRRMLRRKAKFLQEPHSVISQKMPFFIGTTVKTSNLILSCSFNDTVIVSDWMTVDNALKECRRKWSRPNLRYYLSILCRDWGKSQKSSVKEIGGLTQVQNAYLLSTNRSIAMWR